MSADDITRENQKINTMAEQILRTMPSGLLKLEQARYVYLQLGKMVTFDEEYWFANTKSRQKIYKSAQKVKDFSQVSDGKVICVSLANLYNNMMRKIGIGAELKEEEGPRPLHVYSSITIGNKVYRVDLQRDLKYIQSRRKTRYFGDSHKDNIHTDISQEELEGIDNKLGYFYDGERAIDELIERLQTELHVYSQLEDETKHILTSVGKSNIVQQMEFIERLEFYNKTVLDLLENEGSRRISFTKMYSDSDKVRKYTECISVKRKDNKYSRFIYSEKTGTYLEITEDKLQELLHGGLNIINGEKLPLEKKEKENGKCDKADL